MGTRFKHLAGGLVVLAASMVFASQAKAQEAVSRSFYSNYQDIPNLVNDTFFTYDKDFVTNRNLFRQINAILGQGSLVRNSFTDAEIERDADLVQDLYYKLLKQQGSQGPIIRTPDLPNPYNATLLTLPAANATSQIPPLPPGYQQPILSPPVTSSPGDQPVRSLW